jgi:hypothetical protein
VRQASHFRHCDVSILDKLLGHKSFRITQTAIELGGLPGHELIDGILCTADLHRRRPSPQCASLDRGMTRPIDGLLGGL